MAWYKFEKLQRRAAVFLTDLGSESAKNIKGQKNVLFLKGPIGKTGKAQKIPEDVRLFMEKQKQMVYFNQLPPNFQLPDWVQEHFKNGGTPAALIETIEQKVNSDPHHNTLIEAQVLLNELGRDPNNAALIRNLVCREKIMKVTRGKR
jgi:hypothetical protein